ncbi:MAG: 2TM domain-containing protein, partial [Treponema sp.]|nr:2TM domain-containing protein [Treponema sp.]
NWPSWGACVSSPPSGSAAARCATAEAPTWTCGPASGGPGGPGSFGGPGGFDGHALGQNIRAAVEGIVGEIQRNVAENVERAKAEGYDSGGYYRDKYERHIERHRRRMERHELRHGQKHGDIENDDVMDRRERSAASFEEYRNILETRAHRQRGGLWGHLTSYLAVNAALWYINLTTSPHGFLWAAIVSAGWGTGLLSSFASALRSGAKLREIEAMPELEGQSLQDYKRLNKVRDSLAMHAASTIGVSALFSVLQALILGTTSFWLLIPVGAMLVGFVSHLASAAAVGARLKRKILSALGISGGWRNIFRQGKARKQTDKGLGPYAALYREAESTRDAIVEQLRSGKAGPMEDMVPSLKDYVDQVRLLAGSANEIDRLVEAIPAAALGRDREALVAKAGMATSEQLKAEYRSSIAEIEKQEKAYQELKEQSEVVRLRLGSSVNQLKQMRIDIARISAAPGPGGGPNLDQFKRRTEELSRYLEDLRTSFDAERDAERAAERDDPFAELERAERERLERESRERSPKGELGGSAL